jgi:2-polyprenyl-6-methoxyphenol hydroxylase-like FAD-dependent oxidoreductase
MSPVGGVGVNLVIQDAVAAANRLAIRCAVAPFPRATWRACKRDASFRRG